MRDRAHKIKPCETEWQTDDEKRPGISWLSSCQKDNTPFSPRTFYMSKWHSFSIKLMSVAVLKFSGPATEPLINGVILSPNPTQSKIAGGYKGDRTYDPLPSHNRAQIPALAFSILGINPGHVKKKNPASTVPRS